MALACRTRCHYMLLETASCRHVTLRIEMALRQLIFSSTKYAMILNACKYYIIPYCLTLAPIWLPHWPAWRWTISLMVLVQSDGCCIKGDGRGVLVQCKPQWETGLRGWSLYTPHPMVVRDAYLKQSTQQTQDADLLLVQCWTTVADGGPTLKQYWVNVLDLHLK